MMNGQATRWKEGFLRSDMITRRLRAGAAWQDVGVGGVGGFEGIKIDGRARTVVCDSVSQRTI